MKGTEICLLGRRGKIKPVKHNVRQLTEAVSEGHSVKPAIIRDKIVDLMGNLPRIELFARQKAVGWDCIGDEIDGRTIQQILEEM